MSESPISVDELRSSVRDVLRKQFGDDQRRQFANGSYSIADSLFQTAVDLGWFGLSIPERYGGLGLDLEHCAGLYEEIGAVLAPLPVLGCALVAQVISVCASEGQRERYLGAVATGEHICTLDSDLVAKFRITGPPGEQTLVGQTTTLLDGHAATLFLLRASCETQEECWVLLDARERGLSATRVGSIDRTRSFGAFSANGLMLDDDEILTIPDSEYDSLRTHAGVALACDAIGGATAVFGETLEYLKTRQQFDRPIGSFQALKHRCADHRIRIELSRALLKCALREARAPSPLDRPILAALAKAICCDDYARVAADCMQLHGGIGFTWEHPCHLYLRRAKLNQHIFGSSTESLDRGASMMAVRGATEAST